MSCVTCINCGFVNPLSAEPQLQTLKAIQDSDSFVSQVLRRSRPLLESDHALIDDEIARLERLESWYNARLQETQLHWHTILKSLGNRKSIYAPIRRLPRDILVEIFHSVCDSWWLEVEKDAIKSDSLDTTGPLWVLNGVCGHWRNILHTSPVSWARCIIVRSPFSKHAPEILQKYLERTAEHPLSLAALFCSSNLTADAKILSFLVQSSHRWRNISIRTHECHWHYLESVLHFPVLQILEIDVFDDDDTESDMSSNIYLKAPQLWQATLRSQRIDQFMLPSGITHYSGRILCVEDLHLLSQLPKLRTCHLRLSEALDDIQVVMAELRELHVDFAEILNCITAPMLQSLTVVEDQGLPLSRGIAAFLRRSGCRLKSLSTRAVMPLIKNILSLEACSTISYLKLELHKNWVPIFKFLSPSSVLPNLRRLLLCFAHGYHHLETERLALLDMISSRCKAGQLKMIETSFQIIGTSSQEDTYISHDIQTDIRAVIGDNVGMRVEKWSPLRLHYPYPFWE